MANTLRIKRRAAGGAAGAPASLANAELAFNEQDSILYYGVGTGGGGGSATSVIAIAGPGFAAPIVSPAFTGTPTAPTAAVDTATTQIATTAFVTGQAASVAPLMDSVAAVGTSLRYARQDHVHASDTSKANLASPTFTGTPLSTTAAADTATTQIATTAFVTGQAASVAPLMDSVAAVGTSLKYARQDHVHASDTSKANLASPTFTGTPLSTTAAVDTATTQIATTAFVTGQAASVAPLMDSVAAVGTSLKYARQDHVHASDTSKANLASPSLTGTPLSTTAAVDTATTQIATTAFVTGQAASATPLIDAGTGTVGTSLRYARGDHSHPLVRLDQAGAPTASVSLNSQKITNLATPTVGTDAATMAYVDALVTGGQRWLGVRGASTATHTEVGATATTLSPGGATFIIDGVTYINGDTHLAKDQTTSARNGAYTVSGVGSAVVLTRISAMDTAAEVDGKVFLVEDGTANAGRVYMTVSEVTTLGTDAIVFTRLTSATDIVDGAGLTFTGLTLDVGGTAGRISVSASAVDIDAAYVGQASITTLGTITTGVWTGTAIAAANGGTGQAGGYAVGDILQASGASALSKLAAVATGNVLLSGGVTTASAWGKVGLTTHVSGVLTVTNGGTGAATLTGYVKGAGTGVMTASASVPVADISGVLPVANGGIGVGTLTGLAKGNGTSAFSAAVAGTDYHDTNSAIDGGTF